LTFIIVLFHKPKFSTKIFKMKKILFLLGCMLILCIPQAQPADIDIGYQVTLPEDHSFDFAQATMDFSAVSTDPEFVVQITDRSPEVQCEELASAALSNLSLLEAKSADHINVIALPQADVTDLFFQDRNRQCTKLCVVKSNARISNVMSTSNGGSGY
jgi:hypothetical protein